MIRNHAVLLSILVCACSGDKSVHSTSTDDTAPCKNATPQQAADTWLRDRLRSGALDVARDTLHMSVASPASALDSTKAIGAAYGAFFQPFYGDDARLMRPQYAWRQTPTVEAFVLTVPSEMFGQAGTALWTYDLATCSWSRGPMTSDQGGDGGELYRLDAWLLDLNGDGARDVVQRGKSWGEGDDGKPFETDKLRVFYWNSRDAYFAETHVPNLIPLKKAFDFAAK